MRLIIALALALLAGAVSPVPCAAEPDDGRLRIEWEVKNRFRLFRDERDFQRHVAAHRNDGVLGAEARLARESDGRGWARDMVERLCIDRPGRLLETCERDGEHEDYLAPAEHRVGVVLAGPPPPGATCAWSFEDRSAPPRQVSVPCEEEVRLRVPYGIPTEVRVEVTASDGQSQAVTGEIMVRDVLIAGLGDSIAAGEGNPDRPIHLDDDGFCFRRFLPGVANEYFRPARAGYRGSRACGTIGTAAQDDAAWARLAARWMSAACHRSLYGYQIRTALALAVENPHLAVTFIPLACTGARIAAGLFDSQKARECDPTRGACAGSVPGQIGQLQDALARARKRQPDRRLDLILLTVGANDIAFSGLVADVIVDAGRERVLFKRGGLLATVESAQDVLDKTLPSGFARLRAALKPLVGSLSRVVYVTYGHPALSDGVPCPGGRDGFDIHPAFTADPARLRKVATFVSAQFLPKIAALARCEGTTLCRDGSERMTFVNAHQRAFAQHGFCARSEHDPDFDRACFSPTGESFETSPARAATAPLVCDRAPSEFRPYASRARWIRTANDSYFTAMTYPEGALRPADLHDATWAATSAVYGGAIHPTAEGHAAMADAALPAVRELLDLPPAPSVLAAPLPGPPEPSTQGAAGPAR